MVSDTFDDDRRSVQKRAPILVWGCDSVQKAGDTGNDDSKGQILAGFWGSAYPRAPGITRIYPPPVRPKPPTSL